VCRDCPDQIASTSRNTQFAVFGIGYTTAGTVEAARIGMSESESGILSREIAKGLAAGRITLPVLPAVATEVLGLVNDSDSRIGALAATIRNDQALAGHVMKFANSPLLRGSTPMISLQQAISRLGMRLVADIAIAACMGPKLFKAPAYAALIDTIWQESLATAIWAREIARKLRRNVEVAFLCGLLHQIGKPVVLQAVQETAPLIGQSLPDSTVIQHLIAEHTAAAGLSVAQKWNLPELVTEAIQHIGDFRAAPHSPELVAMIAVARALAIALLSKVAPDIDALLVMPELEEINLYRSDVESLLANADVVRGTLEELAL
jgi:putative nucleotidyltransferase with HDIG domain